MEAYSYNFSINLRRERWGLKKDQKFVGSGKKIDHPRHKEDARVLREVRKRKVEGSKKRKRS
jgi:hypothetical protein